MIAIGVVSHIKREAMATQLASDVEADFPPFIDDGTLGCEGNHRRVWTALADTDSEWCLVLEDDALPVQGFRTQVAAALTATPTDVVSLYLGTGRPVWFEMGGRGSAQRLQPLIARTLDTTQACYLTAPKLFHAVAVAIRTPLVPSMLRHTEHSPKPIDFAIGDWCISEGHTVAYTHPSLVDHLDEDTVITKHHDGEPRLQPRKAHRIGKRTTWHPSVTEIA